MHKLNLLRVLLVSSSLAFCYPGHSHAMESNIDENLSSNLSVSSKKEQEETPSPKAKKQPTFAELVQEKRNNLKESMELWKKPGDLREKSFELVYSLMSISDKSSTDFQETQQKLLLLKEEEKLIDARQNALRQRYEAIDKELPEALLEWYRQRETKNSAPTEGILYNNEETTALSTKDLTEDPKVIQIPDIVPNRASQSFYTFHDSNRGLWFGMELLQDNNVAWWRERLGWEATMEFGKSFQEDLLSKLPMLLNPSSESPFGDSQIEQLYDARCWFNDPFTPQMHFAREPEFMSMRTPAFDDSPLAFQIAYQRYIPSEQQRANYLGAFRGFKMNLDRYGVTPTWVAYVSSEKIGGPLYTHLAPTSSTIKMAMSATVDGPFYSPLGIYSSPIARASDEKPCTQLSLPFHSFVAKTMGDIDPSVRYTVTRPLENMSKIFTKSNIPFSSSFGTTLSEHNLPVILRQGRYESPTGEIINFHNTRYTPFVLFDPRTEETYQLGENHPFVTNYYLGGIPLRDMIFPFVTFDRKALAELY